jgi:hypothetical protein
VTKESEGVLLELFEGLFMASVYCQYYDTDSNTEHVEIALNVLTVTLNT